MEIGSPPENMFYEGIYNTWATWLKVITELVSSSEGKVERIWEPYSWISNAALFSTALTNFNYFSK